MASGQEREIETSYHIDVSHRMPYDTRRRQRRLHADVVPSEAVSVVLTNKNHVKRKRMDSETAKSHNIRQDAYGISSELVHGLLRHTFTMSDNTQVRENDCVYLVCEPPGEPYYIGRVMEFTRLTQDSPKIDAIRVNWFYRPRDIQRHQSDSRLVFATMHSDLSPLQSIRGRCRVEHKSQIDDIDKYRKLPDSFHFERLFDKFMRRQYEVIPVSQVINVPEPVRRVLQERWHYVVVEVNRVKELAMEHRACKFCADWCASKDSVRCAICKSDFHMQCVQPPLPRKPTRGFAWSCTECSRAEARNKSGFETGEHELENDNRPGEFRHHQLAMSEQLESPDDDRGEDISSASACNGHSMLGERKSLHNDTILSTEQWPFRYLGIHCNVNDAVDHDDHIYPRAASRIGPRYQALVHEWPGRPIEYFERIKRPIKRTAKAMKGKRSDERALLDPPTMDFETFGGDRPDALHHENIFPKTIMPSGKYSPFKESNAIDPVNMTAAERPPWLLEKPINYVSRGEGRTAERIWAASAALSNADLEDYLRQAETLGKKLRTDIRSPDFLDEALKIFCDLGFNSTAAIQNLAGIDVKSIGQPSFNLEERKRFERGVAKHGSELAQVSFEVGTKTVAECVRYYYIWKKSSRGAHIWANSKARKPKNSISTRSTGNIISSGEVDWIGDNSDDSAYDISKVIKLKKSFKCRYCGTLKSRRWRRASGSVLESDSVITALCDRCADLWRKYAVVWQSPEDVYKKLHEGGARNRKRKFEEELMKELHFSDTKIDDPSGTAELSKSTKRGKKPDREKMEISGPASSANQCAVCLQGDQGQYLTCISCHLCVHALCYGVYGSQSHLWRCDCCINDENPFASTIYDCVLCPIRGDEQANESSGALKRTAGNNWAHITCATWINDLRFGDPAAFQPIEGIGAISLSQWQQKCSLCNTSHGCCISCTTCNISVHVECAHRAGHTLGFDLQPVKSSQSRRDSLALVRIGSEAGLMTPVLHCAGHDLRRLSIHQMNQTVAETGDSALSLYNKTYKATNILIGRRSRQGLARPVVSSSPTVIALKFQELRAIEPKGTGTEGADIQDVPNHRCDACSIQYSAFFFPNNSFVADDTARATEICHKCQFTKERQCAEQAGLLRSQAIETTVQHPQDPSRSIPAVISSAPTDKSSSESIGRNVMLADGAHGSSSPQESAKHYVSLENNPGHCASPGTKEPR